MPTAYLGLGSNLGDREANMMQAMRLLLERLRVEQVSFLYETEPVGYLEQPRFLNAVCQVSTELTAEELLALAKDIEGRMGRVPSFPNVPRPIDIDILLYEDLILETPDLVIPHPRLTERAFVLVLLAELAPDLVHPVTGERISELAVRVGREGVQEYQSVQWTALKESAGCIRFR